MKKSFNVITLNQELVREKLRQKKYDDVCLSSWGHLDEFITFVTSFGLLTMLAQLGLTTGHSGIPCFLLAMLAFVKPLFEIRFDDNIKYLFQDHHVLRLLGFNIEHIEKGYSKRTRDTGSKPIHPDTLRNFLSDLGYKESVGLLVKVVRKLFKLGLIRGGTFNTDTKIIFKDSPGYEFAKKVFDYKGKNKNRRGYKVSIIQQVKSKIVVAVINILTGMVFILISIPLVKRRVEMNHLYGFRISKAFESEENWYNINTYGGKQLIIWSILIIMVGIICLVIPTTEIINLILAIGPITLAVLITIIKTLIYANKL